MSGIGDGWVDGAWASGSWANGAWASVVKFVQRRHIALCRRLGL